MYFKFWIYKLWLTERPYIPFRCYISCLRKPLIGHQYINTGFRVVLRSHLLNFNAYRFWSLFFLCLPYRSGASFYMWRILTLFSHKPFKLFYIRGRFKFKWPLRVYLEFGKFVLIFGNYTDHKSFSLVCKF